jgi:hypothetical protein
MEEFDYFMIRVRRTAPEEIAGTLSGVAERLGTGEKWSFANSDELLRVVGGEAKRLGNMQTFGMVGKQSGA